MENERGLKDYIGDLRNILPEIYKDEMTEDAYKLGEKEIKKINDTIEGIRKLDVSGNGRGLNSYVSTLLSSLESYVFFCESKDSENLENIKKNLENSVRTIYGLMGLIENMDY